jgi:hypothetical protein
MPKAKDWEIEIQKRTKDQLTMDLAAFKQLEKWQFFSDAFQLNFFGWMVPAMEKRIEDLAAEEMAENDLPIIFDGARGRNFQAKIEMGQKMYDELTPVTVATNPFDGRLYVVKRFENDYAPADWYLLHLVDPHDSDKMDREKKVGDWMNRVKGTYKIMLEVDDYSDPYKLLTEAINRVKPPDEFYTKVYNRCVREIIFDHDFV